ncbi:MAG: hypothetical protein ACRD3S_22445 [Terracidiphilus sp.]
MFLFDLLVIYGFSRKRLGGMLPISFVFLAPLNLELFAPQHFAYCDVMILVPLLLILAATFEARSRRTWWLYGAILAIGFALPWLSVHFDKHVPLVSFFSYVGTLAILNLISIVECLSPQSGSSMSPQSDDTQVGSFVTAYRSS